MKLSAREKLWNLATFLQGRNVILIRNEKEMERFVCLMDDHRIDCFGHGSDRVQRQNYNWWLALITAPQNRHLVKDGFDGHTLYAEFQSDKEEVGFYAFGDDVLKWYSEDRTGAHPRDILRGFYERTLNEFTQKHAVGMSEDCRELIERLKVPEATLQCMDLFVKQEPFLLDAVDDESDY